MTNGTTLCCAYSWICILAVQFHILTPRLPSLCGDRSLDARVLAYNAAEAQLEDALMEQKKVPPVSLSVLFSRKKGQHSDRAGFLSQYAVSADTNGDDKLLYVEEMGRDGNIPFICCA